MKRQWIIPTFADGGDGKKVGRQEEYTITRTKLANGNERGTIILGQDRERGFEINKGIIVALNFR